MNLWEEKDKVFVSMAGIEFSKLVDFVRIFDKRGGEDKKRNRDIKYPINEMLFVWFLSVLGGNKRNHDICKYALKNIQFLKKHFEYNNGVPQKLCFGRIVGDLFKKLTKEKHRDWVTNWITEVFAVLPSTLIERDGLGTFTSVESGKSIAMHLMYGTLFSNGYASHKPYQTKNNIKVGQESYRTIAKLNKNMKEIDSIEEYAKDNGIDPINWNIYYIWSGEQPNVANF